ncbi:hypothetical protein ABNN70_12710 [Sporolactobacillus sp. Y61]|uniref:Uncharacterized protein n=1 Tax=Sporolactobacillus sp. Y61 TaxID=3160863 RepID=A0AAU8IE78_9BACL
MKKSGWLPEFLILIIVVYIFCRRKVLFEMVLFMLGGRYLYKQVREQHFLKT